MSFYRKPPQKVTKADTERWHAEQRLEQRFGLPRNYVQAVRKMIRKGQTKCIGVQSNRVTHHKLNLEGTEMIAVWDKKRSQVITFLYENGGQNENRSQ